MERGRLHHLWGPAPEAQCAAAELGSPVQGHGVTLGAPAAHWPTALRWGAGPCRPPGPRGCVCSRQCHTDRPTGAVICRFSPET